METMDTLKASHPAQQVLDLSNWTSEFTGWSVWTDIPEKDDSFSPALRDPLLGLCVAEAKVATRRIFAWTAVLVVLGLGFGSIAFVSRSSLPIFGVGAFFGVLSLVFFGAAVYRVVIWVRNRDRVLRVFREGFSLAGNGETRVVRWRDVAAVREKWRKAVIQGIIHINIHDLSVSLTSGEKIQMDRTLEGVERASKLIQAAVADHFLPDIVERLKSDQVCEFGPFKISRYGIAHGKSKILPWSDIKSLAVGNVGETTLTFYKVKGGGWVTAKGDAVPNLQLFILLSYWFIHAARQPATPNAPVEAAPGKEFDGDLHYRLSLSKKEAAQGLQKKFYIGRSGEEQRLVVAIPPGVASETVYRFPGYGRPNPAGGPAGTFHVAVMVDKGVPFARYLEILQIVVGGAMLTVGLVWLAFRSGFDLITCMILAALLGGLGGALVTFRASRRIGAISGIIGGVSSYFIQLLYYQFMYMQFGREMFGDYEIVLVFLVSAIPGMGVYFWLARKRKKKTTG